MRVTITSDDGSAIVLRGEGAGNEVGWWLRRDGLTGWLGTPAPREGVVARELTDGDLWPARQTQGARTVGLDCVARCSSSVEAARASDRINGLVGHRLLLEVDDDHGLRHAEGFLAEDPDIRSDQRGQRLRFGLLITCPDPLKHGPEASFRASGAAVRLVNEGNAPSWPRVVAKGSPLTYLTLSLGSQSVGWTGSADELSLDFADMVPSSGTVGVDNAFQAPPGASSVSVATDASEVVVYLEPAWR